MLEIIYLGSQSTRVHYPLLRGRLDTWPVPYLAGHQYIQHGLSRHLCEGDTYLATGGRLHAEKGQPTPFLTQQVATQCSTSGARAHRKRRIRVSIGEEDRDNWQMSYPPPGLLECPYFESEAWCIDFILRQSGKRI